MERAVGVPLILVNNVCSEEEVKAAAQAYAEWIAAMENKDGGGADFKVYRAEDYILINTFPICRTIEYRQRGFHPFWGGRAFA